MMKKSMIAAIVTGIVVIGVIDQYRGYAAEAF